MASSERAAKIIVLDTAFLAISTITLILHFVGRSTVAGGKGLARLWWDDYFLVLCFVFACCCNVGLLAALPFGAAGHTHGLTTSQFESYAKLLLFIECTSCLAVPAFKWSLLALYWRLFPTPWFRNICLSVGIILFLNFLATVFSFMFQCRPLEAFWDPTANGKCFDILLPLIVVTAVDSIGIALIMGLANMIIWRLNIPLQKKLLLSVIFFLGLVIIAVSCARLSSYIAILNPDVSDDVVWNSYYPLLLSTVEATLGVIAGSVPGIATLFRRRFLKTRDGTYMVGSVATATDSRIHSPHPAVRLYTKTPPTAKSAGHVHLDEEARGRGTYLNFESGSNRTEDEEDEFPLHGPILYPRPVAL